MKRILFFISIIAIITACSNSVSDEKNVNGTNKAPKDISSRDNSITPANAYSDLFLDTLALSKFINEKKIPDSIANRMRSFYNTRNYQFAWFSSDGLTEQARGFGTCMIMLPLMMLIHL